MDHIQKYQRNDSNCGKAKQKRVLALSVVNMYLLHFCACQRHERSHILGFLYGQLTLLPEHQLQDWSEMHAASSFLWTYIKSVIPFASLTCPP